MDKDYLVQCKVYGKENKWANLESTLVGTIVDHLNSSSMNNGNKSKNDTFGILLL